MLYALLVPLIAALLWPAQPAVDPQTDAFLDQLQASGERITRLSADLSYSKTLLASSDEQLRLGRLYYDRSLDEGAAEPVRRFRVDFEQLILDPSTRPRREDYRRTYVFDGQWLIEMDYQSRTARKRQVVAPGERTDPLRIGQGPFPIPVGQRKSDILERFHARVLPTEDGLLPPEGQEWSQRRRMAGENLVRFAQGCTQLMLTPREDVPQDHPYTEIRLWYRPGGDNVLLPVLARTVDAGGDVDLVFLRDPALNDRAEIPADAFQPQIPDGWDKIVEPWRPDVVDPAP